MVDFILSIIRMLIILSSIRNVETISVSFTWKILVICNRRQSIKYKVGKLSLINREQETDLSCVICTTSGQRVCYRWDVFKLTKDKKKKEEEYEVDEWIPATLWCTCIPTHSYASLYAYKRAWLSPSALINLLRTKGRGPVGSRTAIIRVINGVMKSRLTF